MLTKFFEWLSNKLQGPQEELKEPEVIEEPQPEPEPEPEQEKKVYTEAELNKMKKADLLVVAEELGLAIDKKATKKVIITEILG